MKTQLQQGDCIFTKVESMPANCIRRNSLMIMHGEHGNAHTFESGVAILDAPDGRVFVLNETDEPKQLLHQEHNPITIPPGVYEFGQVVEKDWFTEMVAPVVD